MGLINKLWTWMLRGPAPAEGIRVLERLGVDPVFVSWAHAQRSHSLADLWRACPRADWLIELSVRAGLSRARIGEALESCIELLEEERYVRWSQQLDGFRWIARDWVQGEGPAEPLCTALAEIVNLTCDADDDVLAARFAGREPIGRVFPEERLHADAAELGALQRLADAVRGRLSYEDLHAAVFKRPHRKTPYR